MIGAYKAANATTYTGLSSDTKPTGPNIGDKFIETDTNKLYIYTNAWVELGTLGGTTALGVAAVI